MLPKLTQIQKINNSIKINKFSSEDRKPHKDWPEEWRTIYYKAYPRFKQIILPLATPRKLDLFESIQKRESNRDFSDKAVTIDQFSDLLYYSAGINHGDKRMYPSAGARYPLEVYPFVFNVEGMNSGVYHYHLKTHSLETILQTLNKKGVVDQFTQTWIEKAGVVMVVTAVFDRTEMKYRARGYRHIFTEYGHLAQNMYLICAALGLCICSIGGFIDDGLNKILDIDGRIESVIGVIAIGNKI